MSTRTQEFIINQNKIKRLHKANTHDGVIWTSEKIRLIVAHSKLHER